MHTHRQLSTVLPESGPPLPLPDECFQREGNTLSNGLDGTGTTIVSLLALTPHQRTGSTTDLVTFVRREKTVHKPDRRLSISDVHRLADRLAAAHNTDPNTSKKYVSIGIDPHLAYDTSATVRQAMVLWRVLARPNILIELPATAAGLYAMHACIREGINVHSTLLFDADRCEALAHAYLSGLACRLARQQAVASVESIVSLDLTAIDALIDPLLVAHELDYLRGQVTLAWAIRACQRHQQLFSGDRFLALALRGARPQRFMWSSDRPHKRYRAPDGPSSARRADSQPVMSLFEADRLLHRVLLGSIFLDELTQQLETQAINRLVQTYDRFQSELQTDQ